MKRGVHVSGASAESVSSLLSEVAECGTHYTRLSHFSLQPVLDPSCSKGLVFQVRPRFTAAGPRALDAGLPGPLSQTMLPSVTPESVSGPVGMVARDHVLPGLSLHGKLGGCVGAVRLWEAAVLGAGAGGRPVVWREHVLPGPPGAGLNQVCLKALSSVPTGQAPRTVGSCGGACGLRESAGTGLGPLHSGIAAGLLG